ncbi:capsular biosynthesis protein [Echinicola jeungdonensis]|uniref:protein-tyrosine-phosphatase n=1 Tax=Echinicola jeungdonensis TaxID=709343 RepID=A0ABV5J3V0_9BACT|nr:CpsB/CapC family capsule biosynthesis tyrosine phosphatase [Echinicola jeungdonensis]MDN3669003.1 capsular biosynthesis protein [Echinicola jeungdonensis]
MGLLDLFKSNKKIESLDLSWLQVDMHSHLIPGIDDGAKTLEESINLVQRLRGYGLKKLITTPHIMTEFYKNTPETITRGLLKLQHELQKREIDIEIEAAAEYYLDEVFMEKVERGDQLLTFGDHYILLETGFINKPQMLLDTLFKLEMKGLKPILAHPERYLYLHQDNNLLESLIDRGVAFQINLLSLTGYYSKPVKSLAEKLVDRDAVKFMGTDCHNTHYLDALEKLPANKYYSKIQSLSLSNPEL